ncbi:hypothetical protein HK097_007772 [Rhizophlyctis rosea]|uniref:Adenine DNA glycosylase n=1 Tax=Rhizophlyctis rosea TaxID=64517 RepID=A0AAD5SJ18_9FUNG|nr:hypothetical protein HK097_007772 [Rhizophlyctis rosea]
MPWRHACEVGGKVSGGKGWDEMTLEEKGQRGYEVWVSEVMLQQTQVATVIAYYTKWMKAFPTIFDLAKAEEDTVTQLWAGLGYYSRARRLHEAAKLVVKNYSGILPMSAEELEKEVPGVGAYTAGAIASIAYNLPAPLVDGNVVRVLSRVRAIGADPKRKDVVALHWRLAKDILSHDRPGHFNQALMDLGATVCTPNLPKCGECPIAGVCRALAEEKATKLLAGKKLLGKSAGQAMEEDEEDQCSLCASVPDIEDGSVTRYPVKVEKKAVRVEDRAVCVIEQHREDNVPKYLVVKGPEKGMIVIVLKLQHDILSILIPFDAGLLANLWDFPNLEIPNSSLTPPATPQPAKGGKTKKSTTLTTPTDPDAPAPPHTIRKQLMDTYLQSIGLDPIRWDTGARKDAGTCMHLFSHVRRKMFVEGFSVLRELDSFPAASSAKKRGKAADERGRREWKWLTEEELLGKDAVVGVPATLKKALDVWKGNVGKGKGGSKRKGGVDDCGAEEDEEWGGTKVWMSGRGSRGLATDMMVFRLNVRARPQVKQARRPS